ncbi:hypothetical protein [Arthrobacter roseus]|uniref:hypothetical protein n=1 Tax=Arthrobacter roseus TaxID=136274 RepID=UPI0019669428|nr:hypothetical protein [Arthrobacter roseus]MBM7849220.1 hypothetical protein [Arthrobacter roseus]
MRTLLSALFAIIAIVLTPIAVTAAWMDQQVVSEQGFVELAGPLGEDQDFQSSLAEALSEHLSTQTGLPPELNALVKPVIAETVQSVSTLPDYPEAWDESLRRSHQMIFGDQSSVAESGQDGGAEGTATDDGLTLDIGPIVSLAVSSFSETIGADVDAPGAVPVEVGTGAEQELVQRLERVASVGLPIAVVAGVFAIAALLVARVRSTTLSLMGLGVAVGGAALWLLMENYRAFVPDQSDGAEIARLFRDSLLARAADDFSAWSVFLAAGGTAVFVIGILVRAATRRDGTA